MVFYFINSNGFYTEFNEEKMKAKGSGKAIVAIMRKLAVIIVHWDRRQGFTGRARSPRWLRISFFVGTPPRVPPASNAL